MLLLSIFLCSFSAFSQVGVVITPKIPVTCHNDDQRSMVNWVYDIKALGENESEVTFEFKTKYGACVNGRPVPYEIDSAQASVLLWRGGINLFSKDPFTVSTQILTPSELLVEITFTKKKLFKKDRIARDFAMQFFPLGTWMQMQGRAYQGLYFPWNLRLLRHEDESTSLQVM